MTTQTILTHRKTGNTFICYAEVTMSSASTGKSWQAYRCFSYKNGKQFGPIRYIKVSDLLPQA